MAASSERIPRSGLIARIYYSGQPARKTMFVPGMVGRPAYCLYRLAWAGLDWLYPPQCGGCGKLGSRWCPECQQNIKVLPAPVCQCCGQVLKIAGMCARCQSSPPPYVALRSWAVFDGSLRDALHSLKYKGDIALGEILARPLISMLHDLKWEVDLVTAVPIGVARQAERGYNQAALLALALALGSSITYQPRALTKARETRSQVGLTFAERRDNVVGAFQAQARIARGRRLLVVDDVTTSGATIEACSAALLDAGAREVYGLTLARAP